MTIAYSQLISQSAFGLARTVAELRATIAELNANYAELSAAYQELEERACCYETERDFLAAKMEAIPALVERLLNEAEEEQRPYVAFPAGISRREFIRRLREELGTAARDSLTTD